MKVTQQTLNHLELQIQPVGLWIFASAWIVMGFIPLLIGRITTFTCHRTESPQAICRLISSGLLGSRQKEIPLNTLQGAKVNESKDADGDTYQVVLITTSGEVPFTFYSSSDQDPKQIIVSRINQFLETPKQTTLVVQQDDRGWYVIGGLLVTIGICMLVYLGESVTCIFDKTLGTLTLKRQFLFIIKVTEHQIEKIVDIFVEEINDNTDGNVYGIVIVMRSEERLLLNKYENDKRCTQKTVNCMREFLKLNN